MKRQDTRIESEGAEFLVLGNLLIEGITSFKAYTNMKGYDIVAINPETGKAIKIQVKSRWRTNAPGFIIQNFECDFIVVCRLNRGDKSGKANQKPPEYYIFPKDFLASVRRSESWNKMNFKDIPHFEGYRDQWGLIKQALQ